MVHSRRAVSGYGLVWPSLGILLAVVSVGFATYRIARERPAVYRADTLLLVEHGAVNRPDVAEGALNASERLAATYVELLAQADLLAAAADRVGEGLSAAELEAMQANRVTRRVGDSGLIALRLDDHDPARAERLLAGLVSTFEARMEQGHRQRFASTRAALENEIDGVREEMAALAASGGAEAVPRSALLAQREVMLNDELGHLRLAELTTRHTVQVVSPISAGRDPVGIDPRLVAVLAASTVAVLLVLGLLAFLRANE